MPVEQTVPSQPLSIDEAQYQNTPEGDNIGNEPGSSLFGDPTLDQADAVATVNMQAWLSQSPWRITAGWSAVGGLLSMGILSGLFDWTAYLGWPTLILSIILADLLWGGLWRFAWGRDGLIPLGKTQQGYAFWLPYLNKDSPAGRLMGGAVQQDAGDQNNYLASLLFRVGLPSILLAFGVAAVLGSVALWLTVLVVIATVLSWLARRSWGKPSALLQAIVSIALPWALIVLLFQEKVIEGQATANPAALGISDARSSYSYLLMALWTIHCWGIISARRSVVGGQSPQFAKSNMPEEQTTALQIRPEADVRELRSPWEMLQGLFAKPAFLLLLISDIGIIVFLLYLQEPLWLGLLVPLWLPTWIAYVHKAPVDRQPIWRLAALVLSAIAIGQTPIL